MIGKTPKKLLQFAKGKGCRFTVRQAASTGMKDGIMTYPVGSVFLHEGWRIFKQGG